MPQISTGLRDISPQSHGIFKPRRDWEDSQDVAVLQVSLQACRIESKFVNLSPAVILDPFKEGPIHAGEVR